MSATTAPMATPPYTKTQVQYRLVTPVTNLADGTSGFKSPQASQVRSPRVMYNLGPSRYANGATPKLMQAANVAGTPVIASPLPKSPSPYSLASPQIYKMPNSASSVSLKSPGAAPEKFVWPKVAVESEKLPVTPQKVAGEAKKVPATPEKALNAVGVTKWSGALESREVKVCTLADKMEAIPVEEGKVFAGANIEVSHSDTTSEPLQSAPEADSGVDTNTEVEVEACRVKVEAVLEVNEATTKADLRPLETETILPAAPVSTVLPAAPVSTKPPAAPVSTKPAAATSRLQCFAGCFPEVRKHALYGYESGNK